MNRDKELYDIWGQIEMRECSKRQPGGEASARDPSLSEAQKKKPRKRGEMLG